MTKEVLELFEQILTEEGYRVSLHSYQIQDLEMVRKLMPDLVIVDQLFGEEKWGWQLIQKMRMNRDTAHIPIVVCSSALKALKELEGHLKQKKIDIVIKPFDIDELLAAVEKAFKQAEVGAEQSNNRNQENGVKE